MTDCSCTNFPASLGNVTFGASVGIGTISPEELLETGSGGNIGVRIDPGSDTASGLAAFVLRSRDAGGTTRIWKLYTAPVGGGYGVAPNSFSVWDYPGQGGGTSWCCNPRLVILPAPNAGPAPSQVTIDPAGRLGVGTAAPSQRLTVEGNASLTDGTGTLVLSPTNTPPPSTPAIRITDTGDTGLAVSANPLRLNWDAPSGSPIYLANGGGNIVATVAANGNVGIGTTGPTQKLHVEGGSLYINGGGILVSGDVSTGVGSYYAANTKIADSGGCYYGN